MESIIRFIKERRRQLGLTQEVLASKAGVGLRFIRDLEQGKQTVRVDKVNQVLILFGHELGPVPMDRERFVNNPPVPFIADARWRG